MNVMSSSRGLPAIPLLEMSFLVAVVAERFVGHEQVKANEAVRESFTSAPPMKQSGF